jgi:hypothetical protein
MTLAAADDYSANLAKMPRPWTNRIHHITEPEYETTLKYWAKKHDDILKLETAGTTKQAKPIHAITITDPTADDADKQTCLVTALHGGPERTGTTTSMHAIEWLLSDDPLARETRRRQIVVFMPINNPYAYFVTDRFGNSDGIDPYTGGGPQNWDFKSMTYKNLDENPEVKAFLSVVDRLQPEVHIDLHGTGLQEYRPDQLGDRSRYEGQTMFEVTGSAYSNYALRPWDWRVTEAMIAAGEKAGYPSDRFEADAQRAYWGPAMNSLTQFTWRGRPNFYTAQYAYAKYHTMVAALEIGWEQSGLARLKGLLTIGNERWQNEINPGYPVNRVRSFIGNYVTAYGDTAAERRASRIELWNRQPEFTQAVLYPQTDGRALYIVGVGKSAAEQIAGDPNAFIGLLKQRPEFNANAIEAFIKAGPEIKIAIDKAFSREGDSGPVQKGIGFRLRLPYQKPDLLDVRVNGHLLPRSATDGYQAWPGNGFTQLQINLPPAKSKANTLFVVSVAYRPDVQRSYGWNPPAEVLRRLKAGK